MELRLELFPLVPLIEGVDKPTEPMAGKHGKVSTSLARRTSAPSTSEETQLRQALLNQPLAEKL